METETKKPEMPIGEAKPKENEGKHSNLGQNLILSTPVVRPVRIGKKLVAYYVSD